MGYEVSNKVGGIYTVLVSKARTIKKRVENYYMIGPYFEEKALAEFEEENPPDNFSNVFEEISKKYGIKCHYGRWIIEGEPVVILLETGRFSERINDVKTELWEKHKIDSLSSDAWFNDPIIWSKAAGIVIEELYKSGALGKNVIAHFQEWLTGAGLLHLKSCGLGIKTVFTTHSTVLGRTIAETGKEDLYDLINTGLSKNRTVRKSKAYDYKVQAKHLTEKACTEKCDIFTTVSSTVSSECEFILGRKPDFILHNGLDMAKFPLMEELANMHIFYRERIRRFLLSYFSPYYNIDIENTLFYFISGRNELRNKGIDIFIDSLGNLNRILKKNKSRKLVIAFIWVPENTKERKMTVMENLSIFETIEEVIDTEIRNIKSKLIGAFARGEIPKEDIFDEKFLQDLKKMEMKLKSKHGQIPPITPFELYSENSITNLIRKNELLNREEDPVKVIYYPAYLSSSDGLLGLNYYNAMVGCHLGVFPSYYESWGYTPLETASLGLQSITTDLSGFGRFISDYVKKNETSIMILPRDKLKYSESLGILTEMLHKVYRMSKKERGSSKIKAKHLSTLADWSKLIKNYVEAYEAVLKK
ncbi:MAG: glycogen/starch synthase [Candidatus Aenigmarchaeota archaeon]|nr:glycogen/starch synthase [Candidatus Aenigmarchaeota archaeon]